MTLFHYSYHILKANSSPPLPLISLLTLRTARLVETIGVHFLKSKLKSLCLQPPESICLVLPCHLRIWLLGKRSAFTALLQSQGFVQTGASFLPLGGSPAIEHTSPCPFPLCRTSHLTKKLRVLLFSPALQMGNRHGAVKQLAQQHTRLAAVGSGLEPGSSAQLLSPELAVEVLPSFDLQREGMESDRRKNCSLSVV